MCNKATSLLIDSSNRVLLAGAVSALANFGCGGVTPAGDDPSLAKLSGTGASVLSLVWGDSAQQEAGLLAADGNGDLEMVVPSIGSSPASISPSPTLDRHRDSH